MTNPHYNHTSGVPSPQSRGVSSSIRAEFDLVDAGFDSVVSAIAQVNRQTPWTLTVLDPAVTDYTMSPGQFVVMTCTTAGILRLPASPEVGDKVGGKFTNTLTTNTFARNGNYLMRGPTGTPLSEDMTVDNTFPSYYFGFISSAIGWEFV